MRTRVPPPASAALANPSARKNPKMRFIVNSPLRTACGGLPPHASRQTTILRSGVDAAALVGDEVQDVQPHLTATIRPGVLDDDAARRARIHRGIEQHYGKYTGEHEGLEATQFGQHSLSFRSFLCRADPADRHQRSAPRALGRLRFRRLFGRSARSIAMRSGMTREFLM